NDVMFACQRPGEHYRRGGIDVVSLKVDKLQVILAGEQPDGVHVAHRNIIGTFRTFIEFIERLSPEFPRRTPLLALVSENSRLLMLSSHAVGSKALPLISPTV